MGRRSQAWFRGTMAAVQPDFFAAWTPEAGRRPADFTVRPGAPEDVEACVHLAVAIGAGSVTRWRGTLTRTIRDGQERALFVAEAAGAVVAYGRVVLFRPADRIYYFTADENRVSQELHRCLGFVPLDGPWTPPGGPPADAGRQRFYCALLAAER